MFFIFSPNLLLRTQGSQPGAPDELDGKAGLGGWGGHGQEVQEGGGIWIHTADPIPCTTETYTTLQSNLFQ